MNARPTCRRVRAGALGAGAVGVGLAALLGLGWAGLRVRPAPFPPPGGSPAAGGATALPTGLPPPVARHFRAVFGDPNEGVPQIESAVLTGRGRLRLAGVPFPARLRFTHLAGRAYRHDIDCTWFGLPLLRVREWYVAGRARLELPFGVVAGKSKVDQAANLALWGESVWLPSVLAADPRIRWEAIDAATARLIVPAGPTGADTDALTATFDARTGLLRRLEALRYRAATDEVKRPWRVDLLGWRTVHGIRLPSPVALTWGDEATPWLVVTLEAAAYNTDVDVAAVLRSSGR